MSLQSGDQDKLAHLLPSDLSSAIQTLEDAKPATIFSGARRAEATRMLLQEQARGLRRWLPVAGELLCLFDLLNGHLFCRSISTLCCIFITMR